MAGYSLYISGTNCVFFGTTTQNLTTTIPAFTANTWYHFLVQIDWGASPNRYTQPKVSVWINGTIRVSNVTVTASYTGNYATTFQFNTGSSTSYTKYIDDFQLGQGLTNPITSMTGNITPATVDAAILNAGPSLGDALIFDGGKWIAGPSSTVAAINDLTDVVITSATTGQVLTFNGTNWINGVGTSNLDSLTDVVITSPVTNNVLQFDGTNWVNTAAPAYTLSGNSIDDLGDVVITSPSSGQILSFNGTNWINTAAPATNLDGLSDVVITSAVSSQFLRFDGTNWVNAAVAWTDVTGKPSFATVATSGSYSDLTGKPSIPVSINDLNDVDTATSSPSTNQVLAWNGTNWVPANQSGGSGGGSSSISKVTESKTASSGILTFTDIGFSGTLINVSSDLTAWIVLYDSAASRTADASRAYGTDPASGSGVLAEVYVTAGGTVKASPGTVYYNGDSTATNAIYAAVRTQAGASVNATVTVTAYTVNPVSPIISGTVPASSTASGTAGEMRYDSGYLYICIGSNTWRRTALSTW